MTEANNQKNTGGGTKERKNLETVEYVSPPWNFSWIVAGEVCGSAWPESKANIAFLRSEGVRVLVTLSEERRPHSSAKVHGIECHVIPVEEFEEASVEQIAQFISICEKAREEKKVIYITYT